MQLAMKKFEGHVQGSSPFKEDERACILTEVGPIPIETMSRIDQRNWPSSIFELISGGHLQEMVSWFNETGNERMINLISSGHEDMTNAMAMYEQAPYAPLYRHPRKIWGIGFNYVQHADELKDVPPDSEPVGFMKPDSSLIGHLDTIEIPHQSQRTIVEGELAIIIGKTCHNISKEEAKLAVAGFTTAIDVGADDIHQKNPRFLTRSKSFDTFFSFGPVFVTTDEIQNVLDLNVSTVHNGQVLHTNVVSNMRYDPWHIVAFHSAVMTLYPGDVIITGSPGPVVIRDGDVVECRIDGFPHLLNHVTDLKVK